MGRMKIGLVGVGVLLAGLMLTPRGGEAVRYIGSFITRNGAQSATGDHNWGGHDLTNVGNLTATTFYSEDAATSFVIMGLGSDSIWTLDGADAVTSGVPRNVDLQGMELKNWNTSTMTLTGHGAVSNTVSSTSPLSGLDVTVITSPSAGGSSRFYNGAKVKNTITTGSTKNIINTSGLQGYLYNYGEFTPLTAPYYSAGVLGICSNYGKLHYPTGVWGIAENITSATGETAGVIGFGMNYGPSFPGHPEFVGYTANLFGFNSAVLNSWGGTVTGWGAGQFANVINDFESSGSLTTSTMALLTGFMVRSENGPKGYVPMGKLVNVLKPVNNGAWDRHYGIYVEDQSGIGRLANYAGYSAGGNWFMRDQVQAGNFLTTGTMTAANVTRTAGVGDVTVAAGATSATVTVAVDADDIVNLTPASAWNGMTSYYVQRETGRFDVVVTGTIGVGGVTFMYEVVRK